MENHGNRHDEILGVENEIDEIVEKSDVEKRNELIDLLNDDSIDLLEDEEIIPLEDDANMEDVTLGDDLDGPKNHLSHQSLSEIGTISDETRETDDILEQAEAPKENMTFTTQDELEKHLREYCKRSGFSTRVRNVKPPRKSGNPPKHIFWVCHKGGISVDRSKNIMKPRPTQMVDCKARFNAKEKNGIWMYTHVELEHNHPLEPLDARFLRANRIVPQDAVERIVINDEAGVRPATSYMAEVVRKRGFHNVSFLERDLRNLLQQKRQEKLAGPDSIAMYNYFMKCMKESDKFYFMMDLDDDGRLRNVLWVDARSRAAYKEFKDNVGFDTTYLKNRYDMPFAPFIGINHHGETILLGCALLSREDVATFRWLFKSWVECMGGEAPGGIITDQSLPITRAIELEMPDTRHRWCLWHIMEKQHKKFKGYKYSKEIQKSMSACVYDVMTSDEFDQCWKNFVEEYGLQNNAWLYTLYKERRRWVPAYVNDHFWAGMSTTQRNESVNNFFKGYVNRNTSLREFVLKYDLALATKCEKERLSDHSSRRTSYKIVTRFAAERTFQPIYTHEIFKRVMNEVRCIIYTTPTMIRDEADFQEYKVEDTREFGDPAVEKRVHYIVKLEKNTNHVYCTCKLFEMRGIMCRHSLKIHYDAGVQEVPEKYILRRWRKDVDRPYNRVKVPYYDPKKCENVARYEKLVGEFQKVAIRRMKSSQECDIVLDGIANIMQNLNVGNTVDNIESDQANEQPREVVFMIDNTNGTQTKIALKDPNAVKTVGRSRVRVQRKKVVRKTTQLSKSSSQGVSNDGSDVHGMDKNGKPKRRRTKQVVSSNDELPISGDKISEHGPISGSTNTLNKDAIKTHVYEYDKVMEMFEVTRSSGSEQRNVSTANNEDSSSNGIVNLD